MSEETMTEADKAIARVWKALGISAYAESGGLEISQIVAKRVAELAEARAELARRQYINSQDPWLEHPQAIEQPSYVFKLSEDNRRVNDLWLASEWGCERCREGTCYWRNHLGDWAADLLIASRAEIARKDAELRQMTEDRNLGRRSQGDCPVIAERDALAAKLEGIRNYVNDKLPIYIANKLRFLFWDQPATATKEK